MDGSISISNRPPLSDFLRKIINELEATLIQRGGSYSDFADNSTICQDLSAALGAPVHLTGAEPQNATANGVEMIRHKLSRLACSGWSHRDSWLDLAGYTLLIIACQDRAADMNRPEPALMPMTSAFNAAPRELERSIPR